MQLSLDLGPDAAAGQFCTVAISPDGTRLVFPVHGDDGKQMLATRLVSEAMATPVAGTENGIDPFFSPDGQMLGFFADGKLKKVGIQGGAATSLADAVYGRGASWGTDGKIFAALGPRGPIWQVPVEGGTPQAVTKLADAFSHQSPQALPGSNSLLLTVSSSNISSENASVEALDLKTGSVKILVQGGYSGKYVPTGPSFGHLLYVHEGVLFAAPFDPGQLKMLGPAVPILDDLASDAISGAGHFDFGGDGTFVYRSGKVSSKGWPVWWLTENGKTEPLIAKALAYAAPRFSPDGRKLAISIIVDGRQGDYVYDLGRDQMTRLVPAAQRGSYPTWSPDGRHLVGWFASPSGFSLGWLRSDGAGEIETLLEGKNLMVPYAFLPNGKRLAYFENDSDNGESRTWTLPLDISNAEHPKAGKPEPFLVSRSRYPAVSADGRWIAYQSDESGVDEIYVRPFPGPGGRWQISTGGGWTPIFSRNGRDLFFQNSEDRIMVAEYAATNDTFTAGKPRVWAQQRLQRLGGVLNYDLAPDGKRFAIFPRQAAAGEEKGSLRVHFVANFFEELRRKAPTGK